MNSLATWLATTGEPLMPHLATTTTTSQLVAFAFELGVEAGRYDATLHKPTESITTGAALQGTAQDMLRRATEPKTGMGAPRLASLAQDMLDLLENAQE